MRGGLIRRGITRTVWVTRKYAIKFPSLRPYHQGFQGLLWSICRGILANQSEAEWWRNSPLDQREMMCPVLHSWLGGIINVYPRCDPYRPAEAIVQQISDRKYLPLPDLMPQPGDCKADNYGFLKGRLVVLDYDMSYNGCPHDRSGMRNKLKEES